MPGILPKEQDNAEDAAHAAHTEYNFVEHPAGGRARGAAVGMTAPTTAMGQCEPTLLGSYDTLGEAFGVTVVGTTAFVADSESGLQIIDVSNCPDCSADLNGDGTVNTRDFTAFLNAWNAGEPLADWNDDGTIDTRDIVAYLGDWAVGC